MECGIVKSRDEQITDRAGNWIMTFHYQPDGIIQIKATPRKAENVRLAREKIKEVADNNGGQIFICHQANNPVFLFLARSMICWKFDRAGTEQMVAFFAPPIDMINPLGGV